jgi:predicted ATPase
VWPIPPLAVPAPADDGAAEAGDQAAPEVLAGYDAVRLFVERATSAGPGFVLDAASGPVVAELCRRLDGLPLAIELAAARTRALPPVELAARLEDRFRLLSGGARTLDPRQQTLRATVDWSWDLLEEPDRRLLRRLSVFSGGWTVAAAEAVCGGDGLEEAEVLDGLFRLVDRSLIVRGTAPARFTMLETLRAYGAERLAEAGEAQTLAARHTAWCLQLAERAAAHRTARPWLRRVDADYDNLGAALDRAVAARDHDTALRLAGALGWYWWTTRTIEGRQRLAGVLALADGQPPTLSLARVLQAAAMVEVSLTPTAVTTEQARRSRELFERFGDRWGGAFSKLLLAWAQLQRGGPGEEGARLVEEAYATFAELGDLWGEAYAGRARFVAFEFYHRGLSEQAEEAGQRALAQFRVLDDQWGLAQTHFSLGEIARARGDLAGAIASFEGALAAARDGGPLWVVLASLVELGGLLALEGDDARAAALHAEGAALFRRTGVRRGFAHLYNGLGGVARVRGDLERARQLHQEALAIAREEVGWSVPHTLAQLACAEARLGELDDAEAHLGEAVGLLRAIPQPATAASVLVGAALVAIGHGRPGEAARLLAAAEAVRGRIGVTPIGAERHEAELAAGAVRSQLDPGALAAARAAGQAQAAEDALRALVASA